MESATACGEGGGSGFAATLGGGGCLARRRQQQLLGVTSAAARSPAASSDRRERESGRGGVLQGLRLRGGHGVRRGRRRARRAVAKEKMTGSGCLYHQTSAILVTSSLHHKDSSLQQSGDPLSSRFLVNGVIHFITLMYMFCMYFV
jgi:hypothetical protein